MTNAWTQRALTMLVCACILTCAACGDSVATDGGLPATKPADAATVKSDIEKFNSMKPGAYKGQPGRPGVK